MINIVVNFPRFLQGLWLYEASEPANDVLCDSVCIIFT